MTDRVMSAWIVDRPGPMSTHPLRRVERAVPTPGPGEIRVRVSVCGVCRTDLHLAEGDLPPRRHGVIPGHEIVGTVDAVGVEAARFGVGERVGVAWLRWTCGDCRFCRRGDENLCVAPRFTGWDDDGGYADYAVVDERFAYAIPAGITDEVAAPLLCAGIIGYRALRRANLPTGGTLAIYGFGASAHLAAQVAMREGATVFVMTRAEPARQLAAELGAAWVGGADELPPRPVDAAILFAPVGTLAIPALRALDRGGTLAIAGIYLTDIPALDYERDLFYERELRSVTANTRRDGEEFLSLAAAHPLQVTTTAYPLAGAEDALTDLATDRVNGAVVITVS